MGKKECTNFELVDRFYELPKLFVEMEKRKSASEISKMLERTQLSEPGKQLIPILDRLFSTKGNYPLI